MPEIPEQCTYTNGYNVYHKQRVGRKGGGVALYVKTFIPVQGLDATVLQDLDCLWPLLRPHRLPLELSSLIVVVVYNPPEAPTESRLLARDPAVRV